MTAQVAADISSRFWSKVDKTGDCWEWTAARYPEGYGAFAVHHKPIGAHRVAYELEIGPIPAGLHLDHLCRNRACVNPAHLEAVTGRVNTLRGIGPSAENATKTHCPAGHPYNDENTYERNGKRRCRPCQSATVQRYKRRKKAAAKKAEQQA